MPDLTTSADIDAFLAAANDAAARTELGLGALATVTPGTGVAAALALNVGSAGAPVLFNGAGGTPSSLTGTNITGTAAGLTAGTASAVAVGGITGLGTNVATFLATPSSANLRAAVTDESGTGALLFAGGALGTPASGVGTNFTGIPISTGLTGAGTGVLAALAVNANAGGGLIVLADPGADRIPFWDESNNAYGFLTVGSGLDITGTTITATGAGGTAVTAASAAASAGLLWISAGADRSAEATDTVDDLNTTNLSATTFELAGTTVTATGAELNFVDGVTSAIQTQIDGKQPLDSDLTSWAGVTRASGFDTFAATPSSANLRALLTDETGTGIAYFVGGALGTPASGTATNLTGIPPAGIVAGILGGTITLGESTGNIKMDQTLSADGTWSGLTEDGVSGYTQAFGDLVYLDPTDSRWEAVDANAAAGADGDARGNIGMVVVAATDGNTCTILRVGKIRADAKFPTFTVNNPIYASETAAAVTQTQPTTTDVVIRIVGQALSGDVMYFCPDNMWITHT